MRDGAVAPFIVLLLSHSIDFFFNCWNHCFSILIEVFVLFDVHPWYCRFGDCNGQAVELSLTCNKIEPKLGTPKFFISILVPIVLVAPSLFYKFISNLESLGRVWSLFYPLIFLFLLLFHDLYLFWLFIMLLLLELDIILIFCILFLLFGLY